MGNFFKKNETTMNSFLSSELFDEKTFYPAGERGNRRFTMLFAGGCAPRKGLHYALEAWLKSPARRDGQCGERGRTCARSCWSPALGEFSISVEPSANTIYHDSRT